MDKKPNRQLDTKQLERIIHGQIKHTLNEHPEFFTEIGKQRLSSISKRIAGDVKAYCRVIFPNSAKDAGKDS